MKSHIETLQKDFDSLMHVYGNDPNSDKLRAARKELASLYNSKEVY